MASLKFPVGTKVMCKSQGWYKGVYEVVAYESELEMRRSEIRAKGGTPLGIANVYGSNSKTYWIKPAGDPSEKQRTPGVSQSFQASQLVIHVNLPTERTPESVLAWLMED